MSNPIVRHGHTVEQILEQIPDIPDHIKRRIEPLLHERDRVLEDGINGGLRYTRSAQAFGNGFSIPAVYPAMTAVGNTVAIVAEKQHDSSTFEVDLTMSGEVIGAAGIIVAGVHVQADDGGALTAFNMFAGQGVRPLGFTEINGHSSTAGTSIPAGRYRLTLMAATGGGGTQWRLEPTAVSSLRVTESLY